jgi:hypothetical protein
MYNILDDHTYTFENYAIMARAREMAAAIVPSDHGAADQLDGIISILFDQGLRDPKQIAIAAADQLGSNNHAL